MAYHYNILFFSRFGRIWHMKGSLRTCLLRSFIWLSPSVSRPADSKGSLAGLIVGHIVEAIVGTSERFPDIHVLWNLTVCWGCFCVYWGWLVWGLWKDDVMRIVYRYWEKKQKVQ